MKKSSKFQALNTAEDEHAPVDVEASEAPIEKHAMTPLTEKTPSKKSLPPSRPPEKTWQVYVRKMKQKRWIFILLVIFIILVGLLLAIILATTAGGGIEEHLFIKFLGRECNMVCRDREIQEATSRYQNPPLLLIAVDGLTNDMLVNRDLTPNMNRITECGVISVNVTPSFPPTTFSNLYTIITGLYPSVHGIMSDYMTGDGNLEFDPLKQPRSNDLRDPSWYRGKPLWQTAMEQNVRTASHSWIGNNIIDPDMPNRNPNYHVGYDPTINYRARMQTVLNWFQLEENWPQFVSVFIEDPGKTAREHGLNSVEMLKALKEVDDAIGLFMDNLAHMEATDCFNIVIVSPSIYRNTSCNRLLTLEDYLERVTDYDTSPEYINAMATITPGLNANEDFDTAEELVEELVCQISDAEVFLRDYMPYKYNYFNRHRRDEAVLLMDNGFSFRRGLAGYDNRNCRGARNGFDPFHRDNKGLLIGIGPTFRQNQTVQTAFSNVDIYQFLTRLIDIEEEPNNGTYGLLREYLLESEQGVLPNGDFEGSNPDNQLCLFPVSDIIRNSRIAIANTLCQCNEDDVNNELQSFQSQNQITVDDLDNSLNIRQGQGQTFIDDRHSTLGAPLVAIDTDTSQIYYCQLVQDQYYIAYETKLMIPLYVAFQLEANRQYENRILSTCNRYDPRLDPTITPLCSSYDLIVNAGLPPGVTLAYLYSPRFASNFVEQFDIFITSNMVPMRRTFMEEVWNPTVERVKSISGFRGGILVVLGPIFDGNYDGVRDTYQVIAGRVNYQEEKQTQEA